MILNNKEKERLINNLSWMITDMKYRHDEDKGNLEEGSQGDYSDELKSVIKLLDDIKKTEAVETTGCHRNLVLLNCREFDCKSNRKGICNSSKVTLEKICYYMIGHLRCVHLKCVEAEKEIEDTELGVD